MSGRLIPCTRTKRRTKPAGAGGGSITKRVQANRRVCRYAWTPRKNMPTANKGSANTASMATKACSIRSKDALRALPHRHLTIAPAIAKPAPAMTPSHDNFCKCIKSGIHMVSGFHANASAICANGAHADTGCIANTVAKSNKPRPNTNDQRAKEPSASIRSAVASAMPKWRMVSPRKSKAKTPGCQTRNREQASISPR